MQHNNIRHGIMTIILDTSIFSKNKEYRYFKFYRNLIENFIMKVIRKIYVLTFIISTVATYALIFGDVGYIKRNQIKDELKYLENSVSLLRRENLFLKEEYNSIKKNGLVRETKKSAEKWDITILKFDDQEEEHLSLLELFSLDKGGIIEMRLLFIIIMSLLGACGYIFLLYRK